jgi:hypothetical protein
MGTLILYESLADQPCKLTAEHFSLTLQWSSASEIRVAPSDLCTGGR